MKKWIVLVSVFFLIGCSSVNDSIDGVPINTIRDVSNGSVNIVPNDEKCPQNSLAVGETSEPLFAVSSKWNHFKYYDNKESKISKYSTVLLDSHHVYEVYFVNETTLRYRVQLEGVESVWIESKDFYVTEVYRESEIVTTPIILLGEVIKTESKLTKAQIAKSDMKYEVYIDGEILVDEFITDRFNNTEYEIYAVAYDSLGNKYISETIKTTTKSNTNKLYIYSEPDISSSIIDYYYLKSDFGKYITDASVKLVNGDIEFWFHIVYQDGKEGYALRDNSFQVMQVMDYLNLELENGEILTFENAVLKDYLLPYGYIVSTYNQLTHSSDTIINVITGDIMVMNSGSYKTNVVGQIIVYDYYEVENEQLNSVKLIECNENGLDVIYESQRRYLGLRFDDFDKFMNREFIGYYYNDNPWMNLNEPILTENVKVEIENGLANEVVVREDSELLTPYVVVNLYSSVEKKNIVGHINARDIIKSIDLKLYDLVDNELVRWFEIENNEGQKGFAYRSLNSNENEKLETTLSFNLLLADGKYFSTEDLFFDENEEYIISSLLSPLDMYHVYTVGSYKQKIYGVSMKTGEVVENPLGHTFSFSKGEKQLVVTLLFGEGSLESETIIYNVTSDSLEEANKLEFEDGYLDRFIWVDDSTISCFFNDRYESIPSSLILKDNEWILYKN